MPYGQSSMPARAFSSDKDELAGYDLTLQTKQVGQPGETGWHPRKDGGTARRDSLVDADLYRSARTPRKDEERS